MKLFPADRLFVDALTWARLFDAAIRRDLAAGSNQTREIDIAGAQSLCTYLQEQDLLAEACNSPRKIAEIASHLRTKWMWAEDARTVAQQIISASLQIRLKDNANATLRARLYLPAFDAVPNKAGMSFAGQASVSSMTTFQYGHHSSNLFCIDLGRLHPTISLRRCVR